MRPVLFSLFVALAAACGTEESVAQRACSRADTCNVLATSVKECVETIDTALDSLTPTDAAELEFLAEMCLDHPSCDGFSACFRNLTSGGSSSPTGGGGGGGNPPPPPPPGGP